MDEQLPARQPQPASVTRHVPVDLATLVRVRAAMRALRWSPDDFAGRSVTDLEARRAQRDWQTVVTHG
jgi:hypothetical protein